MELNNARQQSPALTRKYEVQKDRADRLHDKARVYLTKKMAQARKVEEVG
jgi:hypothetical protein